MLKASDGAERFSYDGKVFSVPPTTIRPAGPAQRRLDAQHQDRVQHSYVGQAGGRARPRPDVHGRRHLEEMTEKVRSSTPSGPSSASRPTNPPRSCGCTAPRLRPRPPRAGSTTAARSGRQHHYFEWNNPGFEGVNGYEKYLKADGRRRAGRGGRAAEARDPADRHARRDDRQDRRAAGDQPRDARVALFYGGMPPEKAENSLRLFAEKVLPAVQAMPTPINPASLGQPRGQARVDPAPGA